LLPSASIGGCSSSDDFGRGIGGTAVLVGEAKPAFTSSDPLGWPILPPYVRRGPGSLSWVRSDRRPPAEVAPPIPPLRLPSLGICVSRSKSTAPNQPAEPETGLPVSALGSGGSAAAGGAWVYAALPTIGSVDWVTVYGVAALTFMMLMYWLEYRGPLFVLGFAAGCGLSSLYGFLSGAWPFGVPEAVWFVIAFRRYVRLRGVGGRVAP
jgi:hypothetical protein